MQCSRRTVFWSHAAPVRTIISTIWILAGAERPGETLNAVQRVAIESAGADSRNAAANYNEDSGSVATRTDSGARWHPGRHPESEMRHNTAGALVEEDALKPKQRDVQEQDLGLATVGAASTEGLTEGGGFSQRKRARHDRGRSNPPSTVYQEPQEPLLPPGWEQIIDEETGQAFFYNSDTGESQWERPAPDSRTTAGLQDERFVQEERSGETKGQVISDFDRRDLANGWLWWFVLILLAMVCAGVFLGSGVEPGKQKPPKRPPGFAKSLYENLYGQTKLASVVDFLIFTVAATNFVLWSSMTEARIHPDETIVFGIKLWPWIAVFENKFEAYSFVFFGVLWILRIPASYAHPAWHAYGKAAALRFVLCDPFMAIEMFALCMSLRDIVQPGINYRTNWMFLPMVRAIEMYERSAQGAGLRDMKDAFRRDGKLLAVVGMFGFVVWVVMAGCYKAANYDNEQTEWEAVAHYNCKTGKLENWQKFESIPSSMFFVLIQLVKEHPQADAFRTTCQQCLVVVLVVICTPLFALPCGVMENMLTNIEDAEEDSEDIQLEEEADSRMAWITAILSYGSVVVMFFWTAGPTRFCFIYISISFHTFLIVDFIVTVLFGAEWAWRLGRGKLKYFASTYGFIDIVAWLPPLIHFGFCLEYHVDDNTSGRGAYEQRKDSPLPIVPYWTHCLCILRVFKLERYLNAFSIIDDIIRKKARILYTTVFIAFMMWLFLSAVLWRTEQNNWDGEMREVYASVPRSMWAEIINLHGEFPWWDYTPLGKAVAAHIAIFSVIIFMVPVSVFSSCFQDVMKAADHLPTLRSQELKPWMLRRKPAEWEFERLRLWRLLYCHLEDWTCSSRRPFLYTVLRCCSIGLILLTAAVTALLTQHEYDPQSKCGLDFYCRGRKYDMLRIDYVAFVFFCVEFALRIAALSWRYPLSFIGVCDIVSLVALWHTMQRRWRDTDFHPDYQRIDDEHFLLIPARLLRLVCLENWLGALHSLVCVFKVHWRSLLRTAYGLLALTYFYATLLHIFERWDDQEADGIPQYERYGDMLTSIQYTLVHITGDYPLVEYTFASCCVHICLIFSGIVVHSTFVGIFSGGFTKILEDTRHAEVQHQLLRRRHTMLWAALKLQGAFRRARQKLAQRRLEGRADSERESVRRREGGFSKICRDFVFMRTPFGCRLMYVANAVLVLDLICTLISSSPEATIPCSSEFGMFKPLDVLQYLCWVFFVGEYVLRIGAGRTIAVAGEPFRILDALCLLPTLFEMLMDSTHFLGGQTNRANLDTAKMCRALRLLDWPCVRREVVLLYRTIWVALPNLCGPLVLMLDVWLVTSFLFVALEHMYDGPEKDDMTSIPSAMYWTSIFLLGEWANVDFSPGAGSRLCIFFCIFGIPLFAIPFGIIIEAFQYTLMMDSFERLPSVPAKDSTIPVEGTWTMKGQAKHVPGPQAFPSPAQAETPPQAAQEPILAPSTAETAAPQFRGDAMMHAQDVQAPTPAYADWPAESVESESPPQNRKSKPFFSIKKGMLKWMNGKSFPVKVVSNTPNTTTFETMTPEGEPTMGVYTKGTNTLAWKHETEPWQLSRNREEYRDATLWEISLSADKVFESGGTDFGLGAPEWRGASFQQADAPGYTADPTPFRRSYIEGIRH